MAYPKKALFVGLYAWGTSVLPLLFQTAIGQKKELFWPLVVFALCAPLLLLIGLGVSRTKSIFGRRFVLYGFSFFCVLVWSFVPVEVEHELPPLIGFVGFIAWGLFGYLVVSSDTEKHELAYPDQRKNHTPPQKIKENQAEEMGILLLVYSPFLVSLLFFIFCFFLPLLTSQVERFMVFRLVTVASTLCEWFLVEKKSLVLRLRLKKKAQEEIWLSRKWLYLQGFFIFFILTSQAFGSMCIYFGRDFWALGLYLMFGLSLLGYGLIYRHGSKALE